MIQSPSILLTIAAFLLVLGPLVVVHELGHYLVGRWFGVRADVFSVGFGKELWGRTDKRGTRWRIAALPLGGFVQFAGDMNAASMPDTTLSAAELKGTFQAAPLWQRALIVLAGPVTNLLLAVAIFAGFNLIYGKAVVIPQIAAFEAGAPAQAAGLKVGDRILSVEGEAIAGFDDIRERILPFPGRTVTIIAQRGTQMLTFPVKIASRTDRDQFGNEARIGRIGVAAGATQIIPVGPIEAVTLASEQCVGIVRMMVTGIGQIVSGERSIKELGGPIKIAKYSGEQLTLGWPQFVWFVALISINLGFINLLPIPTLDGGHLAFYAAEAVRRKPVGLRSQEWAFRTGLAFVLALMLFVTINDLMSLNLFGR
ncbi:MAG TPA: RIP metalloprotease RseP [Novosphingobium sp.]|nr:RIP metalloprotease RseP [Novosphingobium sp.]